MTATELFNKLFTIICAFILILHSKLFDAFNYMEEQAELYSIAAKFIYQQAAPRINPLATFLAAIQLSALLVISCILFSRISFRLRGYKKIKVNLGTHTEEIQMVRVSREKDRKPPESQNLLMSSIATELEQVKQPAAAKAEQLKQPAIEKQKLPLIRIPNKKQNNPTELAPNTTSPDASGLKFEAFRFSQPDTTAPKTFLDKLIDTGTVFERSRRVSDIQISEILNCISKLDAAVADSLKSIRHDLKDEKGFSAFDQEIEREINHMKKFPHEFFT